MQLNTARTPESGRGVVTSGLDAAAGRGQRTDIESAGRITLRTCMQASQNIEKRQRIPKETKRIHRRCLPGSDRAGAARQAVLGAGADPQRIELG